MDNPPSDGESPTATASARAVGLGAAFAKAVGEPAASAGMPVRVAVAGLVAWRPWLDEASVLLDAAERDRVSRRRRASDRDALILSYALHRLFLSRELGLAPGDVPLSRDALGCPQLGGARGHTSLSHAEEWVAFAYSAHGPVGVDIEPSNRAAMLPEIADRVGTADEIAALRDLPEMTRASALLALWVRKEALLKAAGIGMAREMHTFPCPESQVLTLPTASAEAIEVRRLDTGGPCEAAVAVSPGSSVHLKWLHPGGEGGGTP
jgi:4'-phosphopantetheinyl transferase